MIIFITSQKALLHYNVSHVHVRSLAAAWNAWNSYRVTRSI